MVHRGYNQAKGSLISWTISAWRFLTSMRTGILLLTLFTIACVMGSLLPQQEAPVFYQKIYGNEIAPLLIKSGLASTYSAPWFVALAMLLGLNLIACTVNRTFRSMRRLCGPVWKNSISIMQKCHGRQKLELQGVQVRTAAQALKGKIKAGGYRVYERAEGEARILSASKGMGGHLGSPIFHLALVVVIAGGIVSGVYRKSAAYHVPVPGKIELTREGFPFDLAVQDFQIDYYPDGNPSQYRSQLTATTMGEIVKQKTIAVNNPLSWQGVKVYQFSYGWMVEGSINEGKEIHDFIIESGRVMPLSYGEQGEQALKVIFLPDYQQDIYGHPFSRSERPVHPRVVYILYSHGMLVKMGEADLGQTISAAGMNIRFDRHKLYTALLVKQDAGLPLVLIGLTLFLTGLGLHFYVKPHYVWVLFSPVEGGFMVYLATNGLSGSNRMEDELMINIANLGKPGESLS
ncbi:MAG: cytochrome c biogenesis protein ResB [Eubacteriales bacterium]